MFNYYGLSPNVIVIDTGAQAVLDSTIQARIDSIWEAEMKQRGDVLYNGRAFNLIDMTPTEISGHYVDYHRVVAQHREPELFEVLNLRPLAVCGLVTVKQGLVFGLRNENLTSDAGMWELAASGNVDDSVRLEDGTVDIREQFLSELCEEINVPTDAVKEFAPFAIFEDTQTHVCDIAFEARLSIGAETLFPLFNESGRDEFVAIDVIPEPDVKSFLQLMKGSITPITQEILAHKGYVKLMASLA